jgi:hypothetical protein
LYYDGLKGRGVLSAYEFYPGTLGAREPVYFILSYVLHPLMSKKWFDIYLSCCFLGVLLLFFHRSKLPKVVVSWILTSIYFLSVFFITERLKLGVLFLTLYFLYPRFKYSGVFILLAILSHAQILILLPFLYSYSNIKINSKRTMLVIFVIAMVVTAFLFKHMMQKLPYYFQNYSFFNIIKPLFFGVVASTFVKEKFHRVQYFCLFIPVVLVALFLGEGRMTLIAFWGSIYFWTIEKRYTVWSLSLSVASCYFSLKGVVFLLSARLFGDGYAVTILDILKYKLRSGGVL